MYPRVVLNSVCLRMALNFHSYRLCLIIVGQDTCPPTAYIVLDRDPRTP